jgi:hypothetical protein
MIASRVARFRPVAAGGDISIGDRHRTGREPDKAVRCAADDAFVKGGMPEEA